MVDAVRNKLRLATIIYWILLSYIIAAIVWWAVLLLQQNEQIYQLKKQNISQSTSNDFSRYSRELQQIQQQRKRDMYKFIGEGATFLLLIIVGAVYVYRSVRRQINVQLQQQNFMMAVTHELKTPIAVSKLNLETLQKYKLEEAKQDQLLKMTLQETNRLDNLINNILISSQLEGNTYTLTKEELNLSDLVKDVVQQFSDRYTLRKIESGIEHEVEIKGDALLLKLLVSNLLENAHKYSPIDKQIIVRLTKDQQIVLEIIDEGTGIEEDEKKNVFKKFYRLGAEQTRKTPGTGLGLYICKKIAKDHQGNIKIKDNQPTGSKFIVQFPTNQ